MNICLSIKVMQNTLKEWDYYYVKLALIEKGWEN